MRFHSLFAGMDIDGFDASFALHVTAPVKLAVASLINCGLLRIVAAAAAKQPATVDPRRSSVAKSALGT